MSNKNRKSIPAPAPAPAARATSPSLAPQARHTCASLRRRHGTASREVVCSYVWGMSTTEVHALGQRATEARLVRDGERVLGAATDFLDGASPSQKELLASIDGPFLAAASTALDGVATAGERDARRDRARTARRAAEKRAARGELVEGRKRRAVYVQRMLQHAGGSAAWRDRLRKNSGAAEDLDALAASLDALAVDAAELRAEAKAAGAKVLLDEGFEARLRGDATSLRARAARADEAAPAAAGDRVWNRGVAAWFVLQVVDAFGSANALDPTVPRVGLQQLRQALRPRPTKKAKKAEGKAGEALKKADAKGGDAKGAEGGAPAGGDPAAPVKG